jgi:hypothetical protein
MFAQAQKHVCVCRQHSPHTPHRSVNAPWGGLWCGDTQTPHRAGSAHVCAPLAHVASLVAGWPTIPSAIYGAARSSAKRGHERDEKIAKLGRDRRRQVRL